MEHYVGLDVSLKLTAICIVDQTGKIQREGVVHSDPEAIAAFIKSNAPHVTRIGLEMTCHRTFIQQQLESRGFVRRVARVEQRAIGGAGRGCAADRPLR